MLVTKSKIETPMRSVRRLLLAGVAIIGVTFLGFGGWAATSPIASASVATGQVVVSSRRQTIQHLEGGIVAEIKATDGDFVKAGTVLVRLDETRARVNFRLLQAQFIALLGERSRLEAERDGLRQITWAKELLDDKSEPETEKVMRGQRNVFESRREYMAGQEEITVQKKRQLEQEIEALDAQLIAERKKQKLIQEEMEGVEDLYNKGLEKKPRVLALRRAAAEIEGTLGQISARIARSRLSISELSAQFSDLKNRLMTETVQQLREAETKIADVAQRLRAANDTLTRIEIKAPRDGYIVNSAYHTVGGVIDPARPIMEIVPSEDSMQIEARLDPRDIDSLKVGLPAEITLTPYSTRSVPPLDGKLVMLSADSITDQRTGASYYLGRVEVNASELEHLPEVKMVPGMPAQVMIRTGERTALQYLVDPFRKSINRAFREK